MDVGGNLHSIFGIYFADLQSLAFRFPVPKTYIVIDIETTGFSRQDDEIIEIAAVKYQNTVEVSAFHSLVQPQCLIPARIAKMTGISNDDVANSPPCEDVLCRFFDFIEDFPLVGHNIKSFDIPFITQSSGMSISNQLIDTLLLARKAFPDLPHHDLKTLKTEFNIESEFSHQALHDVRATNKVYLACAMYQQGCVPNG